MNSLERFLAVCHGERPDYVPIFGFHPWAAGMSGGCQATTYDNLRRTGMPDVGGRWDPADVDAFNQEGWKAYWGTETQMSVDFFPGTPAPGIRSTSTVRDGFEYVEYETGALTRQVLDNDVTYSMPEFIRFDVYDRASFERYKALCSPSQPWTAAQLDAACKPYENRTRPLWIPLESTWGSMRSVMGMELACTVLYDDPALAHDFMEWQRWQNRAFWFPVIERLKPEVVALSEDFCYNHGMMISAAHFNEFCAEGYREINEVVKQNGVTAFLLDCDGFVEPALPQLMQSGVNAVFPWEVKSGNDLYRVRENHPELILFGGVEKECANAGNAGLIRAEMESKRDLIRAGRYFPNGDHGMQPLADFETMCKFMTVLHEVTENPTGTFPRMQP